MSDASVVPGTSPVPPEGSLQKQIDELEANGIATTFLADIPFFLSTPKLGQPVSVIANEPNVGITALAISSAISTRASAQCVGVIIAINEVRSPVTGQLTNEYKIQSSGKVVLTEAEWAHVTGEQGGLTGGETYFLDASGVLAQLPPSPSGDFSSQVGVALNSTTLLLSTPSVPIRNP